MKLLDKDCECIRGNINGPATPSAKWLPGDHGFRPDWCSS
jgi:hypothetical protein